MSMRLNRVVRATVLGPLLALVVATSVHAVDGVIEINQVRAKAGGVTPGDTPLFPVTISQPGSYRLTGNLDVTDASARTGGTAAENTTAIQVNADNVTIDLNGFMIKGPTACSGSPLSCSPEGSGVGIDARGGGLGQTGVAAMNGSVRGMGSHGLVLTSSSMAEKIRALSNGGVGIAASVVADCVASINGSDGIEANTVTTCVAIGNDGNGIEADTVANCRASGNEDLGIDADTVIGCTASSNDDGQIQAVGAAGHNVCNGVPCP
jgi:hypothetical protein